jgi:hypothetical protein
VLVEAKDGFDEIKKTKGENYPKELSGCMTLMGKNRLLNMRRLYLKTYRDLT